jgi:acyl CoA:acetate/3-ketoacid CoA transferase alpha subunit
MTAVVMTADEVAGELRSGMTIGIGGWGSRRKPMALVRAILRSGLADLTVVSYGGPDVGLQVAAGRENYIAKQLPMIWMPQLDEQISAVSSKLQGTYPQDPDGNVYPENWYFVK